MHHAAIARAIILSVLECTIAIVAAIWLIAELFKPSGPQPPR